MLNWVAGVTASMDGAPTTGLTDLSKFRCFHSSLKIFL